MRYANFKDHASCSINHGDYLQFMVIDWLYEKMGIDLSDVYYISGYELEDYQGESLLLPINFVSSIMIKEGRLAISEDIIPIFLGLSFSSVKEKFDPDEFLSHSENRAYFLKFAPVGCRDAYTYDAFRRHRIPAYLNGCLTSTIPLREKCGEQNKVFFVDAPADLLPHIPKHFFENCEFATQQSHFSEEELGNYQSVFSHVRKQYLRYQKEASLIITSRLHVAVPCTAMGIPVVFAKDYIDTRFSWLEKLLPLYPRESYDKIDWNPQPPEYEDHKQNMIKLALFRMHTAMAEHNGVQQVDTFYSDRVPLPIYHNSHLITHRNTVRMQDFMKKNIPQDADEIRYALWGINQNAVFWDDYIRSHIPNAKLTACIDTYQKGSFRNLVIHKPEYLEYLKGCYIFVLSVSAVQCALDYFERYQISPQNYCIVADTFIYGSPK